MSLLDKIKSDVKKSGGNRGKFTYFKENQKQRIRFLTDLDDGLEVVFHDSFEESINVPCQELFGRNCPYCERDGLRTRSQYAWSVYNYDTEEVQVFMFPVNNCSPVPALVAMYENYGTLLDRDFVISVTGKKQNKTFSVVPMDKVKFRVPKVKAFSDEAILKMLDKAFPADDLDDDEDNYKPVKKSKKKVAKKQEVEEDDEWDDEEESVIDYEEMSPRELYKLCKERDIEAMPKKTQKYYVNLLEEYDAAQDEWDDEEEDDEWDDE